MNPSDPTGRAPTAPTPSEVVVEADPQPPEPDDQGAPTVFWRLDAPHPEPARVRIQQISATHFKLLEGFRYEGRGGRWEVRPDDLPATDLASIPQVMGWFASSYGRYTLAALLHDHLVHNGCALEPEVPRHVADNVFVQALDELGVSFLRSRILWAGVVSATRLKERRTRFAMLLWILAAVVGVVMVAWSSLSGQPWLFLAALVAPVPFAALWGRREYRAGVVGGYTLWFASLPTIVNFAFYSVYEVAERVAQVARRLRPFRPAEGLPPPPGPPSFGDR